MIRMLQPIATAFWKSMCLSRSDARREAGEEIRSHLDMLEDRYISRGMSEEEAARAALERFGDPDRALSLTAREATRTRSLVLLVASAAFIAGATLVLVTYIQEAAPCPA